MFESAVGLGAAGILAAAEANHRALIEQEVRRLVIAAQWADLHPGDAVDPDRLPGRERAVTVGGDGTPELADFCLADLATSLQMSAGSAARLIGAALDLRHRLPGTWAAAREGRMPTWQARRVAATTRHLTIEQARLVDARVAPAPGTVSWGRLQTRLQAAVYDADPEGVDAAAEQAARERFVRLGRTSEHGLRLIWAKVTAGDALWGNALVARLAEILHREGDHASLDVRRSKAFGLLLSQPAEALRLLNTHQDDDEPDHRPEPDWCLEPVEAPESEDDGTRVDQGADAGGRSLRIGPPPFDPARARPRAIVYVHLSEEALTAGRGLARVEDVGPVLLTRLRQLLGDRCQVLLKPVIDLNDTPAPVDSYEIPARIAEHLRLRQPVDVFPYAAGGSRRTDLDHTIAYRHPDQGGPPGQTGVGKLGPLVRYHHRVKTHGRWQLRQPEPGVYLWRCPHGRIYLVNATGTHPLGNTDFARQIWRAAKAPPPPDKPPEKHALPETDASQSHLEQALRGLIDAFSLAS